MSGSQALNAAILVISETASKDPSTDKCIPALEQVLREQNGQWNVMEKVIVPDNILEIQRFILNHTDSADSVNFIVTSGGTGFATKDVAPEAVTPLLHKQAPGLVHGMLAVSLNITPFALMARPVAGVRNKTLIVTLPGSPKGAKENLEAIIKLLPHACLQAAGANSRQLHAGGVKKLEQDAGLKSGEGAKPASGSGSHSHHHHHHHHHHHGGHLRPVAHPEVERALASNDVSAGPSRRHRESPYPMFSAEEALQLIAKSTPQPVVTKLPVNGNLVGHVLAEDVVAAESVPAFRASIVDGYAIKFPEGGGSTKGVFPVAFVSHAKPGKVASLHEGQVARITTGAPLPPGADAVVMVEHTILKTKSEDGKEEKEIEVLVKNLKLNENVREPGSDVKVGTKILFKGEGITAIGGELGLLASVGVTEVDVYRKPVVGVMSTGDEIVEHDKPGPLALGEVRDTNRPTLLTSLRGVGFEAVDLGRITDKEGALEEALRAALRKVDVIITSGGVSMGELDLLKPTIERTLGGTIHFGRVSIKPGKPTTFATIPFKDNKGERKDKVIFSLPGNPASAVVCFNIFVLPSLHQSSGVRPHGLPRLKVILDHDTQPDNLRTEFQRAIVVSKGDGQLHASTTGGQRSSRIGSFKGANGLLILPPGKDVLKKGEKVDALLMGKLLSDMDT